MLVAGASAGDHGGSEILSVVCGLGIAFFYIYQIIDSVRSARSPTVGAGASRSIQPDPRLSLPASGSMPNGSRRRCNPDVVGAFFLLHTLGLSQFGINRFWPILLIVLGGWMFATDFGMLSESGTGTFDPRYRFAAADRSGHYTTSHTILALRLDVANFNPHLAILSCS